MTKTISFSNLKGGVGKTTSTLNIGAALHKLGKKVLIIDLDPQANLSQSLGIFDAPNNIYGALMDQYKIIPIEILEGFDLIPSTIDLSAAEGEIAPKLAREFILKKLLKDLKTNYDYVLIDCPPSIGMLTTNALTASDQIIIPLEAHFLPMQGLSILLDVIERIKLGVNSELKIGGIFFTRYDDRKVLNRDISGKVDKGLSEELFNTKIRNNIALAEAPTEGLDIFRYNEKSNGAEDYKMLTQEIINRNEK